MGKGIEDVVEMSGVVPQNQLAQIYKLDPAAITPFRIDLSNAQGKGQLLLKIEFKPAVKTEKAGNIARPKPLDPTEVLFDELKE